MRIAQPPTGTCPAPGRQASGPHLRCAALRGGILAAKRTVVSIRALRRDGKLYDGLHGNTPFLGDGCPFVESAAAPGASGSRRRLTSELPQSILAVHVSLSDILSGRRTALGDLIFATEVSFLVNFFDLPGELLRWQAAGIAGGTALPQHPPGRGAELRAVDLPVRAGLARSGRLPASGRGNRRPGDCPPRLTQKSGRPPTQR